MTIDEKLNNFYTSAIDDAEKKSVDILEEYKQSLKQIYDRHEEEELRKEEASILAERDSCIREKNKVLSTESIDIRKRSSEKTKELIDILYTDVEKQLVDYMKTPEYITFLEDQIMEAKNYSRGEEMTLYINSTDADKKAFLEGKAGIPLTISSINFLGGTRAVIHAKHILIDNSFSTKLSEGKESFIL